MDIQKEKRMSDTIYDHAERGGKHTNCICNLCKEAYNKEHIATYYVYMRAIVKCEDEGTAYFHVQEACETGHIAEIEIYHAHREE